MSPDDLLLAIYRDVEAALAGKGFRCEACGRCCDFARNDYILYASRIESDLVQRKTGRQPELVSGRCCFQDVSGRCTIHQWGPLGCRTFFCTAAAGNVPDHHHAFESVHEDALRRIKELTEQTGAEWDYGRFFQ
ncbi:MAG TPA: YkgJ family cysteine cluster protein [Planctomycetota bacterium]|nr:YkgJ family cysteine cluster protein [Planctomycetota bacterium]